MPIVKRKIGYNQPSTTNQIETSNIKLKITQLFDEKIFNQLKADIEIQNKITNAALILASDQSAIKSIRKQRTEFYEKAKEKVNFKRKFYCF